MEELVADSESSRECYAINPLVIQALRSGKFDDTYVATRAFEKRLQVLFKMANSIPNDRIYYYGAKDNPKGGNYYHAPENGHMDEILGLYIQNIDQDLYVTDSIIMSRLKELEQQKVVAEYEPSELDYVNLSNYASTFEAFYNEKLTNVKDLNVNTKKLSEYLNRQMRKNKKKLEADRQKMLKELNKKTEKFEKAKAEYRETLWQREKYRMERFTFEWSDTGWVNVDVPGPLNKDFEEKTFNLTVENASMFDRIESYIVFSDMQSISRLNTDNLGYFFPGGKEKSWMYVPRAEPSLLVSVGYKLDKISIASVAVNTGFDIDESYTLKPANKKDLKALLKPYSKFSKENQIEKDLEFQVALAAERERQAALHEDDQFLWELHKVVYGCTSFPTIVVVDDSIKQ